MEKKNTLELVVKGISIAVLLMAITILVYHTGGLKFVYSHAMYLAILMGAYFFGLAGGITTGLFAGIILGPWMPVLVETGEMQSTVNWLYRLAIFVSVGGVFGAIIESLQSKVQKLRSANLHHPITGLRTFIALEQDYMNLKNHNSPNERITILVCAIQNFDELVSTFSYRFGEALIKQFTTNITENCPKNIRIYQKRMGQFIILVPGLNGRDELSVAESLKRATSKAIWIDDIPVHLEIHIGTNNTARLSDCNLIEEVRHATVAQERAVKLDRQFMKYSPAFEKKRKEAMSLLGKLRHAIVNDDLYLEYQAKFSLNSEELLGVEALIRWQDPVLGRVAPGDFIPYAETSDLIHPLTDWVIDASLKQLRNWKGQGFNTKVAINISMRNLQDKEFPTRLMRKLSEYAIPPESIELEVTEWALMKDQQHALETLKELSEIPIFLSIDDFGTGFSSLQYINKIPARAIKIDKVFIDGIEKDASLFQIVRAATKIGHALNMDVIAEGVETDQQYHLVKKAQCDAVQGFYAHRPSSADAVLQKFAAGDGQKRLNRFPVNVE